MDVGEDELRVGGITLKGVTRGGIQTCVFVPELGVMFDAGGRVPGQEVQPGRAGASPVRAPPKVVLFGEPG